jgi:hypothetical protein
MLCNQALKPKGRQRKEQGPKDKLSQLDHEETQHRKIKQEQNNAPLEGNQRNVTDAKEFL